MEQSAANASTASNRIDGLTLRGDFNTRPEQVVWRDALSALIGGLDDGSIILCWDTSAITPRNNRGVLLPKVSGHVGHRGPDGENLSHCAKLRNLRSLRNTQSFNRGLRELRGNYGGTEERGSAMLKDDDSREAVAARLERIREFLNYSKREFAVKAGISEQTYNGYSSASRPISMESAKKFRKTYGLPLDFILFGSTGELPMRYLPALQGNGAQQD
nr:helix-turn-helix transcriptional regulator [Rhodobacter aestuarii]